MMLGNTIASLALAQGDQPQALVAQREV